MYFRAGIRERANIITLSTHAFCGNPNKTQIANTCMQRAGVSQRVKCIKRIKFRYRSCWKLIGMSTAEFKYSSFILIFVVRFYFACIESQLLCNIKGNSCTFLAKETCSDAKAKRVGGAECKLRPTLPVAVCFLHRLCSTVNYKQVYVDCNIICSSNMN
jgi:hypothetical protein